MGVLRFWWGQDGCGLGATPAWPPPSRSCACSRLPRGLRARVAEEGVLRPGICKGGLQQLSWGSDQGLCEATSVVQPRPRLIYPERFTLT